MKDLPEPKSCADLPDNPEYEVQVLQKKSIVRHRVEHIMCHLVP